MVVAKLSPGRWRDLFTAPPTPRSRQRSLQVAQRLDREGIKLGDRVATIAWNTWRHLEAWYGIMGIGAICHTVNPRLFPEQIAWIINHAEDRLVMTDLTFVPILEKIASQLPSVERFIILTDAAHMPQTTLKNAVAYEEWIAEADGNFKWTDFDENTAAAMCYTSGTTGDPKGVLYSHRSNVLHALMPPALPRRARHRRPATPCCPVVPMFHANAWGIALRSAVDRRQAGDARPEARRRQRSTSCSSTRRSRHAAGVPTVWLVLLQYLEKRQADACPTCSSVVIGGSALPPRHDQGVPATIYGVDVLPRLGHDRDEPARHRQLAASAKHLPLPPRAAARRAAGQAGPPASSAWK
ncbi:MAG: AMP-binding protein [Rhodopseudomonas palustris]|nr:AMP-binding protein [Rhodopseudomonas palustris]